MNSLRIFVYPGSFDPITNGHLDIIERASRLCDKLIVAILINPSKNNLFSMEERESLINKTTGHVKNLEVQSFEGLLIDFVVNNNATSIIKGLRAVSDFEYELQMASLNKKLNSNVETLFMMTSLKYSFLSSSSVKELAKFNGKIEGLVPDAIINIIYEKFKQNK